MMRVRAVVLAMALLPAGGCTRTEWVNPSADSVKAAADREECEQVARIEAQQQVLFESLSRRPVLRGGMIGYPQAGSSFSERNREWYWTQHFLDRCMQARGYRLMRIE